MDDSIMATGMRIIRTHDGAWSAYTCVLCGYPISRTVWRTREPIPEPPENPICERHEDK